MFSRHVCMFLALSSAAFVHAQTGPPTIDPDGVRNAASQLPGFASGAWFVVRGSNLAQSQQEWKDADVSGAELPSTLGGVSVTINGLPLP